MEREAGPKPYQLRNRVRAAVYGGDPEVLTIRSICKALEKEFGHGKVKPSEVRRLARYYLNKRAKKAEEVEEFNKKIQESLQRKRDSRNATHGNNSFLKVFRLSPELQALTGHSALKRSEVVQHIWQYIRENQLQDPGDRKTINCAGNKLFDIFNVDSINMFTMNKHLQRHLLPMEEGYEDIDIPKKSDRADTAKRSAFLTPYPISDALRSFLGTDKSEISRAEALERVWEYIRDNDLQKAKKHHRVVCDDKLRDLLGCQACSQSTVSRLVARHFAIDPHQKPSSSEADS